MEISVVDAASPVGWAGIQRLLGLARTHLGMDVAWVSQFTGDQQIVRAAEMGVPGGTPVPIDEPLPLEGTLCFEVVAGRIPALIPDTRRHPVARDVIATHRGIGSYIGTPWHRGDGTIGGMLCCLGIGPTPTLDERSSRFMALLADLISDHLLQAPPDDRDSTALHTLLSGPAPRMLFQPVVRLDDGETVAFEALARFESPAFPTPAHAFAAAARLGVGERLEHAALRSALAQVDRVPPGARLTVNLSARALIDPDIQETLFSHADRPIGVELTEHTPVPDYAVLAAVTDRLRAEGVCLLVDDAGAGYASFRHVLRLRPDIVKLDLDLIRGIDTDPVLQALAGGLVSFAESLGATLIAEGIETVAEHETLRGLGITLGQGHLFGRPGALPELVSAI